MTAVAVALIAAPVAHASTRYGPAMPAAQVRSLQTQGVREIIVKRDPGLSAAQEASLRAQAGITYVGPGPLPNTELDRAPAGGLAAAVAALRHDSQVQYAEPNGELHAASVPNDTYFADQWALSNSGQTVEGASGTPGDDIGAMYAWPHSTGSGVTVAEVDTGADYTAPDLQGQLQAGVDYVDATNGAQDQNGHGTHVAGIIAAVQNNGTGVSGVAPGAQVLPLRVLDATGSGTIDDVASAFAYAGQQGIPIVNASLGGPSTSQTLTDAVTNYPNTLYVVAAGNGDANNIGYDVDSTPFYPCDIPAPNLICVGATDQNDQPAYFSNYGAANVDLFAPGVNILSTYLTSQGGYAWDDGTSMATPMVSGTLALMLARNPSLTAAQLKSDLLASTDPEPQLDGLSVSGGELDAAAAVATAGGEAPYAAPGNRELPDVSGSATVGSTLTVTAGNWSRTPTQYSYQWQRCVLGVCLPVPGATGTSYTLATSDYGAAFDAVVSAGNATGQTQAQSIMTATVGLPGQPPPTPSVTPPASTSTAPAPLTPTTHTRNHPLTLSHVAVIGKRRSKRGEALVFTLSAPARVQVALAGAGRAIHAALRGRQGRNRYTLRALLSGRHGRFVLTVRAGGRTVRLKVID